MTKINNMVETFNLLLSTYYVFARSETTQQSQERLMEKHYYVYILTNKTHTALYTGVTNDIIRRVYEHKEKLIKGFTFKYNVDKLVYYEIHRDVRDAITREKQIKGGSRKKKVALIEGMNSGWKDLYGELV